MHILFSMFKWWLLGAGGQGDGKQVLTGCRVSFWGDKHISEVGREGRYTPF